MAENFFAALKSEEAHHVYTSEAEAYVAIDNYIYSLHNPTRLQTALGYQSPGGYAKHGSK